MNCTFVQAYRIVNGRSSTTVRQEGRRGVKAVWTSILIACQWRWGQGAVPEVLLLGPVDSKPYTNRVERYEPVVEQWLNGKSTDNGPTYRRRLELCRTSLPHTREQVALANEFPRLLAQAEMQDRGYVSR
jgi:hypothetical protein